jgi:DUF3014 family protein
VAVVVVLALGAAGYFFWPRQPPPPPPPPLVVEPAAPLPQAAAPHYPIEEKAAPAPEAKPLPALKESDPALREGISSVVGAEALRNFFYPEDIVRRIVATVDNLPRKTFAARLSPVKPVGGLMATSGSDAALTIAPENDARYLPYVRLMETVNVKKLVGVYVRFYPLFQQAYMDLGFPTGYFNDRLVEVIDHLLATPDVAGPVKIVAPHVLYQFADPQLEALSAGQKLMIRIGRDNAARVKVRLREIRREVLAQAASR